MGIGENIRNNRKNKGLTQKELGLMIGISASTVTKYEKEDLEPNIETLQRIAEALGVSLHELITGESLLNESETLTQSVNTENIDPHLQEITKELEEYFGKYVLTLMMTKNVSKRINNTDMGKMFETCNNYIESYVKMINNSDN